MKIVFAATKSLIGSAIRYFDGGPYNHVALIFGDMVVEAQSPHGVTTRSLRALLDDATATQVLTLSVPDEDAGEAFARSKMGCPYDYLAIFDLLIRGVFGTAPHLDSNGKYICDELVLSAIEAAGVPVAPSLRAFGVEAARQWLLQHGAT